MGKRKPILDPSMGEYSEVGGGPPERWKDLDEGIVDLVKALSYAGYATWASDEGGRSHSAPFGWISFNPKEKFTKEEIEDVKDIVRQQTNVPFRFLGGGDMYSIQFSKPLRQKLSQKRLEALGDNEWDDFSWFRDVAEGKEVEGVEYL